MSLDYKVDGEPLSVACAKVDPYLRRLSLRLTKNKNDAEDLVQDTYVKVMEGLHLYRDGTKFKSWVLTIATNSFNNDCRKRDRFRNASKYPDVLLQLNHAKKPYLDPENAALAATASSHLSDVVDEMNPSFRIPVILADILDYTQKEISSIIDCPKGTVMSRTHRGRKHIREQLEKKGITTFQDYGFT